MSPDIETVAADWLARHFAGLSSAEEAEFQRWLAADAKRAATYGELAATWRALDQLRVPLGTEAPRIRPLVDARSFHRRIFSRRISYSRRAIRGVGEAPSTQ